MSEMEIWESGKGISFLKRIGVRSGQTVADFGARVGHYVIPASRLVGMKGRVYAFDRDSDALAELERKEALRGADNIITIKTAGGTELGLADQSVDVFLLYDVLHLMPASSRHALYEEVLRVLKASGFLSVYPKHVIDDDAGHHFKNLTAEAVGREVCVAGFVVRDKVCGTLSHDDTLVRGCVWNFTKKPRRRRLP
jgi:ubiquinone/menaquinone biosynthesis C-methylase UbiE